MATNIFYHIFRASAPIFQNSFYAILRQISNSGARDEWVTRIRPTSKTSPSPRRLDRWWSGAGRGRSGRAAAGRMRRAGRGDRPGDRRAGVGGRSLAALPCGGHGWVRRASPMRRAGPARPARSSLCHRERRPSMSTQATRCRRGTNAVIMIEDTQLRQGEQVEIMARGGAMAACAADGGGHGCDRADSPGQPPHSTTRHGRGGRVRSRATDSCRRRPRVAIQPTGTELVAPGASTAAGRYHRVQLAGAGRDGRASGAARRPSAGAERRLRGDQADRAARCADPRPGDRQCRVVGGLGRLHQPHRGRVGPSCWFTASLSGRDIR